MISIPLSLAHLTSAAHAPAAWFIAGDDPEIWLAELSHWCVPLSKVRLFVLPSSQSDCGAAGVLVILEGTKPADIFRAEAYGCLAGRVFIPTNARLEPSVSNSELENLTAFEFSVLHPGVGWVGFRAADAIGVLSLVELPTRIASKWDRAQPGASPYPRLVSVEPDVQISLDDLMNAARDDIGTKEPTKLPPHGGEMNPVAKKALIAGLGAAVVAASIVGGIVAGVGGVIGGIAGGLGGIGGFGTHAGAPAKSGSARGGSGMFDAFKEWARAHVERWNEHLENARNREIDRLMRMLESDPDNGLSYAIPIGGNVGQSRGVSKPGASLVRRGTNFDLSSLRGGGAADYWSMPERTRKELRQKYVDAANRELSLGRFRRAAYIFSELLGEHKAAANALKQGRHFREAAVIYRDVVKNKGLAAECLEEGGLITEAIVLREELKQWLHVARLYEVIERPADARKAYRKAADELLGRHDLAGAAGVLSDSMSEHDEALAVLARGWPDTSQAEQCLAAQFTLLGKLGRHTAATKVVQGLRASNLQHTQAQMAVEICSKLSATYPDAALRIKAADIARVITGERIAKIPTDRLRPLAAAVAALAPDDRLLARDTTRYVEQRIAKDRLSNTSPPRPLNTPTKQGARRLIRTIQLPHARVVLAAAAANGKSFYVAGKFESGNEALGLLIVRGLWSGEMRREAWAAAPITKLSPMLFDAPRRDSQDIVIGPVSGKRIEPWLLPTCNIGPAVRVGTPNWVALDTIAFSYDEQGAAYAVRFDNDGALDGTLDVFRDDGVLTAQYILPYYNGPVNGPLPMAVRKEHVFVSDAGSGLISFYDGKSEISDLGSPIRAIIASAPFTRLRIAVAQEEGGWVLWPDSRERKQCRFGHDMASPVIGFTRGGDLIAVTKSEVRVYHTESETVSAIYTVAGPGVEPFAVLPAEGVDEYAVFLKNGSVEIWRV